MSRLTSFIVIMIFLVSAAAHAIVVSGSATVTVQNDNVKQADLSAKRSALSNALYNYFARQQETQPDAEIPEITQEYFKFIKSYKIADRHYNHGTITYSVIADIDKVSLSDVAYMIKSVSSTAVFIVRGTDSSQVDSAVSSSMQKNQFSARYQSDFRASMGVSPSSDEALEAFGNVNAQYFFDITLEPLNNGDNCTVALTAKIFGKSKDYGTLRTNGEQKGSGDDCIAQATGQAMTKLLSYVRGNYIPLPDQSRELSTVTVTASNYSNFAAPKNIMEAMKKRTFITSYNVTGFAEKTLTMDVQTYISPDMLLGKLRGLEKQYGFSAGKDDSGNITLDFTEHE